MRSRFQKRSASGFTLIELMITVGIIGLLAAIAIPNFLSYQARSRRSEAFTNLASLARSYKAYSAENNAFPDMLTETGEPSLPDPAVHNASGTLGTEKMPWDAPTEGFFDLVGWRVEGQVFYSYDVNSACGCTLCFTATAHGDVDGDGLWSALMYVFPQRDTDGTVLDSCDSAVGFGGVGYTPPVGPNGPIYDEVAVRLVGASGEQY